MLDILIVMFGCGYMTVYICQHTVFKKSEFYYI